MTIGNTTCYFDVEDEISEYDCDLIGFTLQALGVDRNRINKHIEMLKSGCGRDTENAQHGLEVTGYEQ
jgi:hypothetical protein